MRDDDEIGAVKRNWDPWAVTLFLFLTAIGVAVTFMLLGVDMNWVFRLFAIFQILFAIAFLVRGYYLRLEGELPRNDGWTRVEPWVYLLVSAAAAGVFAVASF